MFGTPIISDNGLPLLTENIFQTSPIFYLETPFPSVYWNLGYLSKPPPPSPIIWNWRVLGFFYFELFICTSDIKRSKSFMEFTQWTPTKAPLWICYEGYSTLRPYLRFTTFENSILDQKTGISRTAWIKPWVRITNWDRYYKAGKLFLKVGQ